jgi:ribonuclease III
MLLDEPTLDQLQEVLGVQFADTSRLQHALTHRSAASDNPLGSNERLEFVGDSVISLVICEHLFSHYPDRSEGDLAKARAYVVSEPSLAEAAESIGLHDWVQMSSAEAATGGRRRRSILSDAFEALMAAIYLDCGLDAAKDIILRLLTPSVESIIADVHKRDYKSSLQEITQASHRIAPLYVIVSEDGSEHDKTFVAHAMLGDECIGQGEGKSKKEAEQAAAKNALDGLETTTDTTNTTQSERTTEKTGNTEKDNGQSQE